MNKYLERESLLHKSLIIFLLMLSLFSKSYAQERIVYGSNSQTGQYVQLGELKLYYESYGEGEPLLLIHGGLGSIEDFKNNITDLSKHFNVIAVDSRDYGRSNNPSNTLSYQQMAIDMNNFLTAIGIDKAHVFGFSDGGVIGLYMAAKFPNKVLKVATSGANYLVDGLKSTDFANYRMTKERVKKDKLWQEFRSRYQALSSTPEHFDEHIQKIRKMWLRNPYIPKEDFIRISAPVFLLYGDKDSIKLEHGLEMFRLLNPQTTQLTILPNANHLVYSNQSDLVNPLLIKFFNSSFVMKNEK